MTIAITGKDPSEVVAVQFDYTLQLATGETINTATTTASVVTEPSTAADPTPASVISGAAVITGSKVTQKVQGGVAGVLYHLRCTITTSGGQTLVLACNMRVETA